MRRLLLLFLLLLAAGTSSAADAPFGPQAVQTDQTPGWSPDVATRTFTLAAGSNTNLGPFCPEGTRWVWINIYDGNANIGPSSTATAPYWFGQPIASGGSFLMTGLNARSADLQVWVRNVYGATITATLAVGVGPAR
jgi:hypothetical protein